MRSFLLALLFGALLAPPASTAVLVFAQPHDGGGTLHKSSWYSPDGLDGDVYCWDAFSVPTSTAITEVHWRGGYEYHPSGSGQAPVASFNVSIYRSIAGNSQPDVGTGGRLASYNVANNANETPAGSFGGVAMYDYALTLGSPFQAVAGTVYWVQIEAAQGLAAPSYAPDWGLAVGTGGNNSHFLRITGASYQYGAHDLAFSLYTSGAPAVTIAASESPTGSGTITGAGNYPIGSTVSLQATPATGWGFVNWTENGTPVSTNAHYTFTASTNRTLVANFDVAYGVTTSSWPGYAGTTTGDGVYVNGSNVTVTAVAKPGFVFNSWSDGSLDATHTFAIAGDTWITAFFDPAVGWSTYDFDGGPFMAPLPITYDVNGLLATFTGGYSTQQVGTLGIAPAGFSGWCLWPSSIFASDLGIAFADVLQSFSVLYAVDELACDTSARMRVNAYLHGAFVGTNTITATPGVYPSATLSITSATGFDSVVVHWDAPGTLCQDYGPIFFADNVTVQRLHPPSGADGPRVGALSLAAPAPNPFRGSCTLRYTLPRAGDVRLSVYDLAGRLVRRVRDGAHPAGPATAVWDGRDEAGRLAPAGLYLVRLVTPDGHLERRAMRLP